MNIDKVVDVVKRQLDDFGAWQRFDADCESELIEDVCEFSEDDDAQETLYPLIVCAIYALTLNDSRFDSWRFDFVNECH